MKKSTTLSLGILLFLSFMLVNNKTKAQAPANDNPAEATTLPVTYLSSPLTFVSASNLNATNTYNYNSSYGYTQVPNCVLSAAQQKDIWFSFNSGNKGNVITFTVNEITGSPSYGHANLFRLFSTTNCDGTIGSGVFTEVACQKSAGPTGTLPSFTVTGITANTCYFLQMSCYASPGSVWSSFDIAASGNNSFALPIEDIILGVTLKNNCNELNWEYKHDANIKNFIIERYNSTSKDFVNIQEVTVEKNDMKTKYSYTDCSYIPSNNFYRLKMTDVDSKIYYSNTSSINNLQNSTASIYPNPIHDQINIKLNAHSDDISFAVYNLLGQNQDLKYEVKSDNLQCNCSQLPTGNYIAYTIIGDEVKSYIFTKK